jgi:hypothetical protein
MLTIHKVHSRLATRLPCALQLLGMLCLGPRVGLCAQEQDSRMARLSPLYPPQGVVVEFRGKVAHVSWQPILLDRLADYEVYRWNGKGEEHWEEIGTTVKPEFVDKRSPGKSSRYKVVAIDRSGKKSALSQSPVSVVVDPKTRTQHQ